MVDGTMKTQFFSALTRFKQNSRNYFVTFHVGQPSTVDSTDFQFQLQDFKFQNNLVKKHDRTVKP